MCSRLHGDLDPGSSALHGLLRRLLLATTFPGGAVACRRAKDIDITVGMVVAQWPAVPAIGAGLWRRRSG